MKVIELRPPPRIPRDRVLTIGGAFWIAFTTGVFVYGAIYLLVRWVMS